MHIQGSQVKSIYNVMLDQVKQAPCSSPSTLGFSPGTEPKIALIGVHTL